MCFYFRSVYTCRNLYVAFFNEIKSMLYSNAAKHTHTYVNYIICQISYFLCFEIFKSNYRNISRLVNIVWLYHAVLKKALG